MERNTLISLENRYEKFIKDKVNFGRYGSVSEVIHSALDLLEREEMRELELIKALELGVQSGFTSNFDAEENLKALHARFL